MSRLEPLAVFEPLESSDPVRVGGYELVARLGAGGMGKVYLSHTPAGRPIAIKVIRPEFADDPESGGGSDRKLPPHNGSTACLRHR